MTSLHQQGKKLAGSGVQPGPAEEPTPLEEKGLAVILTQPPEMDKVHDQNPAVGCPPWCDHLGDCRWKADAAVSGNDYRVHERVISDEVQIDLWENVDTLGTLLPSDPALIQYWREDVDVLGGLTAEQAIADGNALLRAAAILQGRDVS